ncbi:tumor necrosis factor receptor superfamily member 11B-like [Paramormyrops kingsleyae]|uniref:tumor necrosis factor receptor superfamily member 11B-like n=1 Tax=Paramormyrops kingsleyae TaxID=1676925 RepID=UPI003B96B6BF
MEQPSIFHKVSLLGLMLLSLSADVTLETPTYDHEDHVTGRKLSCNRCPPGYHMVSHCTTQRQTECAACPAGHFTQYWNYLSKCLYCSNFCSDNQIVKEECSPTHNRVCACKEGYYWHAEFCIKHAECPPGYGVKRHGTAVRNTQCEQCTAGSFSAGSSSRDPCRKHTNCTALGQHLVLKGTTESDNLCLFCRDVEHDAIDYLLREFLPDLLGDRKRLRRAVSLLPEYWRHTPPQGAVSDGGRFPAIIRIENGQPLETPSRTLRKTDRQRLYRKLHAAMEALSLLQYMCFKDVTLD